MKSNLRNKQIKIRRTAAQWQKIMRAYQESGLSQDAFCAQQSIAASTFYKWRQRLAVEKPQGQIIPEFIELTPTPQAVNSNQWEFELSLSSTIVLRIRQLS